MIDVAIVGGGPAGQAAALILARACRSVLWCDGGTPRNAASRAVHGFPTRDGTPPAELRRLGREELRRYDTVTVRETRVDAIEPAGRGFLVHAGGKDEMVRRVILCAGLIDDIPELLRPLWGKGVYQCPYCHAYEIRGRRFALLASGPDEVEHVQLLRAWTSDVTLLTGGTWEVPEATRQLLAHGKLPIDERPVARLRGRDALEAVEFADGSTLPCEALFAHPPQRQTQLVMDLKLALDEHGFVKVDEHFETSVPGIHAAGDLMSRVHGALVAAGNGAAAAYCVNIAVALERVAEGSL